MGGGGVGCFFFFFSSRRRHTRLVSDWSSDVCSSDLFLMFLLTLLGRQWEDQGALVFRGIIMGMVTLVATIGMYSISINGPAATASGGNTGPDRKSVV